MIYRKCVGIIPYDKDLKKFLICKRSDQASNSWQFPQGGVDDLTLEEAAKKELFEETGLQDVIWEPKIAGPYRYDYPMNVKRKEKGQEQFWFLCYCKSNEVKVELNYEFVDYKWEKIDYVLENIIYFKKPVYCQFVDYFLINNIIIL